MPDASPDAATVAPAERPVGRSAGGARDQAALAHAYAAARRGPRDPAARLALATALARTTRLDLARRHARRTGRLVGAAWPQAAELGQLLFRLGDFDGAAHVLRSVLRRDRSDATALRTFSALLHRYGREAEAKRCLALAAQLTPFTMPRRPDPAKPSVLRLQCVENSHYGLSRDKATGLYKRQLKRGHFSLKDFLDTRRVNVPVAHLVGDNLLTVEPPDFDLVINTIGCPDLNPAALTQADRFLKHYPAVPVINQPHKVMATTRGENAQRLGAIDGVRFARTETFVNDASPAEVAAALEARGFGYPLIVRVPGTQTGSSMTREDDRAGLIERLASTPWGAELYAIEYLDVRDRHGYYHKTRAFFIDRVFYPVANLTSDVWQIHSADRYRVMDKSAAMRQQERRYLANPQAYFGRAVIDRLHAICRIVDLDFFGIDFTVDRAGQVVVFEANAAMRHNFDHAGAFTYTRPYLQRISRAFMAMVEARLGGRADQPAVFSGPS